MKQPIGFMSGGGTQAVGTINNATTFPDVTTDFTVTGNATATITASAGKIQMAGGTGGSLFTNYVRYTKAGSPFIYHSLEQWHQRVRATTPASLTVGTFGVGVGMVSANNGAAGVQMSTMVRWSWDTGDNKIYLYYLNSTTSQSDSGATTLVPTANTDYYIDVTRDYNIVTVKIFAADNTTQLLSTTFTQVLTFPAGNQVLNNVGSFALQNFGGSFSISSWLIDSTAQRFCKYLAIGDSNMQIYPSTIVQRYFAQSMIAKGYTYQICAGYGDRTREVLLAIPFYLYMSPTLGYFLCAGSNDIADGILLATWQANHDSIMSQLAAQKTVFLASCIARSVDVSAHQTYIAGKANAKANFYGATQSSGVLNGTYNSGDGIHGNLACQNVLKPLVDAILP